MNSLAITSTISPRRQTTIPEQALRFLGAQVGDRILYDFNGDSLTLKKVKPIQELAGAITPRANADKSVEEALAYVRSRKGLPPGEIDD